MKDLNIRGKTIKYLEENIEENLHDFGFGNVFLRYDTKSTSNNKKLDKLDFAKI